MVEQQYKLKKCALGLSLGLTWSFGLISLVIINVICPTWGNHMIELIGNVYLGYEATFWGAVLGALWGFADGFIGGFFIALFYNLSQCCCCPGKHK